jgi:hypothetical protein
LPSFQTKYALICKIQEQDKVYVLTRSVHLVAYEYVTFFNAQMFHTVVTKKLENSSHLIKKCTCVGTFPITWWYNSDQWHLPLAFRSYAYLMVPDIILLVAHPGTLFS